MLILWNLLHTHSTINSIFCFLSSKFSYVLFILLHRHLSLKIVRLFLTGSIRYTGPQTRGTKMALPMLRRCYRVPATISFTRLFFGESVTVNWSVKRRAIAATPAAVTAAVRPYSTNRGGSKQNQKIVVVGIPNPFIWLRTRIYYFLIRAYFDKEFNIEEFTEGAKQVRITFHEDTLGCLLNTVTWGSFSVTVFLVIINPCDRVNIC